MSERIYRDDALLTLSGELDIAAAGRLERGLERCLADRVARVVIDAADLWFMGLVGVRLITDARDRAAGWGGEITVRGCQPAVARVLAVCDVPATRPATTGVSSHARRRARPATRTDSPAAMAAPEPIGPATAA